MDVLQAENATLQLEKDTLCAERNALLESNNSYHAQYEELKEFERLHSIDEARSPDRDLRDLHQGTVDLESAVPFATLCEDLHALQRHAQALQAENDAATLNVSELEERFESESGMFAGQLIPYRADEELSPEKRSSDAHRRLGSQNQDHPSRQCMPS